MGFRSPAGRGCVREAAPNVRPPGRASPLAPRRRIAFAARADPMFEQTFKNIDDVLWKDAGCTSELDYTEQTS